jgi:hypothetical protein
MVFLMRLRWSRKWDVALALAGAVSLLVEGLIHAKHGLPPGAYALAIVAAAPVAWRGPAPMASLLAAEAGAIACVFAFDAGWAATAIVV